MDVGETQRYMFALFRALYRLHADNIMHRDIKPSNFLANENRSDFLLVDFGLAERWVLAFLFCMHSFSSYVMLMLLFFLSLPRPIRTSWLASSR